jgi:transcriptional regulator with XRE-family HTH domain
MNARNVLHVNGAQEQADYREAVAEILRRVQSEHGRTLLEISEQIDVSLGTISNAANKKSDLCAVYLRRLGKAFGPNTLDPYLALIGGRAVPIEVSVQRDVLPFLTRAANKIAIARSPDSPGGAREIHTEKADYLPDLRALRREVDALIHQIEAELAA